MNNRKPNRLKNYDYSKAGCYFVTICTNDHFHYFGEIKNGEMKLNDAGIVADNMWKGMPKIFKNIELDVHVIMPNHIHGIIAITKDFSNNAVGDAYPRIENKSVNNEINIESKELSVPTNMCPLHSADRSKMYLSKIIRIYKSAITKKINNELRKSKKPEINLWQRSFYDRIIRNEKEFRNIQGYIYENPVRWDYDIENRHNKLRGEDYYSKLNF